MSDPFMQESVSYLISQIGRAHRNLANILLADLGLHVGQEVLLMHLGEQDGLTQSELVERMNVEPPTLTKMLQRLESSGFVERRKDIEDARAYRVYLTDSGRSLQEPLAQCWKLLETRTLQGLTLEERILLRRLLLQVRNNLTEI